MMNISYRFLILVVLTSMVSSTIVFAQADNETVCPGQGYLVANDWDGDGFLDVVDDTLDVGISTVGAGAGALDNCVSDADANSEDVDGDTVPDVCDNCPSVSNKDQKDVNANGIGDVCEVDLCVFDFDANNDDLDGDSVGDVCDNCPLVPNVRQEDLDADGTGDACDDDVDGDLVLNARGIVASSALDTDSGTGGTDSVTDTASDTAEETIVDTATDTFSDTATDTTGADGAVDSDGSLASRDNCPLVYNPNQSDMDGDGLGDACDADLDGDGFSNDEDFCPFYREVYTLLDLQIYNSVVCLGDSDEDGVPDYHVDIETGVISKQDNCQFHRNGFSEGINRDVSVTDSDDDSDANIGRDDSQKDMDGDGIGDACDLDMDGDGVIDTQDNCVYDKMVEAISAFNEEQKTKPADKRSPNVVYSGWTDADWLHYLANPTQIDEDKDRVGDSCDLDFKITGYPFNNCYVVLDDSDECLEVTNPKLQVYSPAVIASKTSDDPIRLRIFANKPNVELKYTWYRIAGDADGIEIKNATGIVNCSSGYEYHYAVKVDPSNGDATPTVTDLSATFETKLSGSYKLELMVEQFNEDGTLAPPVFTNVTINSSGIDDYIAESCDCATVGSRASHSWLGVLLLLLVGIVLRRRFS